MTQTLSQKLRKNPSRAACRQAANRIEELERQNAQLQQNTEALSRLIEVQLKIMDKAASIMVDAMGAPAGINKSAAAKCIDVIRGIAVEMEQSTHEMFVQVLLDRIAVTAGIESGINFDPLNVLDHMRVTLAAQGKLAPYLEWTLARLFDAGDDERRPVLLTGVKPLADANTIMSLEPGTTWMQALDDAMRLEAPQAPVNEPQTTHPPTGTAEAA